MKQVKNRQPKKPPKSPQDKMLNKPLTKKEKELIRRSVLKIWKDFKKCFELLGKV